MDTQAVAIPHHSVIANTLQIRAHNYAVETKANIPQDQWRFRPGDVITGGVSHCRINTTSLITSLPSPSILPCVIIYLFLVWYLFIYELSDVFGLIFNVRNHIE